MKKRKWSMTTQIVIAMVIGIILGLVFGEKISRIKLIGDIFLRLIQMSVVLLIMGVIMEAVGSLDPKELGRLGAKMFVLFLLTTALAAFLGLFFGNLLQPGAGMDLKVDTAPIATAERSMEQIILDFFPSNIIDAMANTNMIQVIIFSIFFGVALGIWSKKKQTDRLLLGLKDINEVLLQLIGMVMKMAPLGIGALLAYSTSSVGMKVLAPMMKFLLILGFCSFLHLTLHVILVSLYCKVSPLKVAGKLSRMTVVAFTTTSSAITLPVKMEDSEKKLGVSKRISHLVNPLGMTLNSNGLSMYLALSCVTVAQFYGVEFTMITMVKIVVLATLACLGTVAVPGGGLVALAMVIPSLGLPLESIALLSGIDWFSGMFRTVLNVDIDALIAMVIAKDEQELDLKILHN